MGVNIELAFNRSHKIFNILTLTGDYADMVFAACCSVPKIARKKKIIAEFIYIL